MHNLTDYRSVTHGSGVQRFLRLLLFVFPVAAGRMTGSDLVSNTHLLCHGVFGLPDPCCARWWRAWSRESWPLSHKTQLSSFCRSVCSSSFAKAVATWRRPRLFVTCYTSSENRQGEGHLLLRTAGFGETTITIQQNGVLEHQFTNSRSALVTCRWPGGRPLFPGG